MFLENIKYEHVEVLLTFKFLICLQSECFRSVETTRLIMITIYTNMTYHEYEGTFDIALFLEKLSKVAQ